MTNRAVKILLVDDQQLMRQGLRQLIEARPGLTIVGEASSGSSALEQIKTFAPHLVLMNIDPAKDENRVENPRHILAQFPLVKIIALSSESELSFVLEVMQAGVSGYVAKQQGFEELFRAIQIVMDYGHYLSPPIASAAAKYFLKSHLGRHPTPDGVVLSDREQSLLQMIATGKRNKEISVEMEMGLKSVETYRFRLMKKLGCGSVAELVHYAIRVGIVRV